MTDDELKAIEARCVPGRSHTFYADTVLALVANIRDLRATAAGNDPCCKVGTAWCVVGHETSGVACRPLDDSLFGNSVGRRDVDVALLLKVARRIETDRITAQADALAHRLRCEQFEQRVAVLERASLADVAMIREQRELLDCATSFQFGNAQIQAMHFSDGWQIWDLRKGEPEDGTIGTRDEAIAKARELSKGGDK